MGLRDNLHESISNILGSWKHNINNVKKKEEEVALLLDYVTQQLKITMRLKVWTQVYRGEREQEDLLMSGTHAG